VTTGYRRLLLKLSGEGLAGERGFGIHPFVIGGIAEEIRGVHELGIQISLVIGGGHIIRGMTTAAQGAVSRPRSRLHRLRRPTPGDVRYASSRRVGS